MRLRNALKIRKRGFLFLKTTNREKKRPLSLRMNGLSIDSPQERMTLTMLATKLLTMESVTFSR